MGRLCALLKLPLGKLDLPLRSTTFLQGLGIATVGDLLDRFRIAGLPKGQAAVYAEVQSAIRSLFTSTIVDLDLYRSLHIARKVSIMPILPRRRRLTWSGYQFAQDLPQTAFEMVKLQFNAPHRVVLRHRLLPEFRRRSSLGEVASILKVTRQRVRLIEKRIILVLRRALLEGDYRRCHFCFRPAFAEPLKDLAVAVKQVDAERVITQRMWRKMVQDIWNLQPSDLGSSEQLILQILGVPPFRHLGSGPTAKPA